MKRPSSSPESRAECGLRVAALAAVLLVWGVSPEAAGQTQSASDWVRLPFEGGEVRSIALDPRFSGTLYLGTGGGEIYRSTDGGDTWNPPRPGIPFPGYVLDALIFDPSDPGRLWVAGWGLWGGGVVADSRDGGYSWQRRDRGIEEISPRALAVGGGTGVPGRVLFAGGLDGVHVSRDDGASWRLVSQGTPGLVQVASLAIDPQDPGIVYAGTWRRAYKSFDGGESWCSIHGGMVLDSDVFEIVPDPRDGRDLWAATCGWVYHSEDGGLTWERQTEGFKNRRVQSIARHPEDPLQLIAGSCGGLHRSFDGGNRWWLMGRPDLVVKSIKVDPRDGRRIYIASEADGFLRSTDGGANFEARNRGLFAARLGALLVSRDGVTWATRQDSGSASGLYASTDRGQTWQRRGAAAMSEPLCLGEGLEALWVGTASGLWRSGDSGRTWSRARGPVGRIAGLAELGEYRMLAAGEEGVWTSTDGAEWRSLGVLGRAAARVAAGWWQGKRAVFAGGPEGLWVFAGGTWEELEARRGATELAVLSPPGARSSTLVVSGPNGVRALRDREEGWMELRDAERNTLVARLGTSARDEFAAIVDRAGKRLRLFDARLRESEGLPLPHEARHVRALAIDGVSGSLLLGTTGYGLFARSWEAPRGGAPLEAPAPRGSDDNTILPGLAVPASGPS